MRGRFAIPFLCLLGGVFAVAFRAPPAPVEALKGVARAAERARNAGDEEVDGQSSDHNSLDRGLALPTGDPTSIQCDDARTIVAQARVSLAASPPVIDAAKFTEAAADWLDPHGLWSVAPDAPVNASMKRRGERLLAELQAAPGSGPCVTALEIGGELVTWSTELRALFDQGAREGAEKSPQGRDEAWRLASSTPFEDGAVTRSARELVRELGRQAGALRAAYGPSMDAYLEAARNRAAPKLDAAGWSRVVTAAEVRAYIPQLDAHGAWAPLDEEISIYDLALEATPPERLWAEMTRTAVGVRIDRGALAPLLVGDVVLDVQGVPLAGVSVEQAEQLSVLSDARPAMQATVKVLRAREPAPIELTVGPQEEPGASSSDPHGAELAVDTIRYGEGQVAIVVIPDVPDDLGVRLEDALARARATHDIRGVVLDLRANGGGSTDGAMAAIGVFLPGVSLFPMRRRDGAVEIERSPQVAPDRRWDGPLAVLVDGDSASAAEMIAGAIGSYRRGVVIGDKTYGKGCAQEYLDDDAHVGVLRLTTLLYALPDGSPVQKIGISPQVRFSLPSTTEREASLTRALGPWRGPDVRDLARVRDVPWPGHTGHVGPCHDSVVCRALRALGTAVAAR